MENLECQGSPENQEGQGYLEQRANLVQMVVKGQQDLLGLKDCQAHLDCLDYQNQVVKGYQASKVRLESLGRKVCLDFLVLKASREREDLDFLVYQG